MCSIKEDVCKARMEKVESIGEDVTKLTKDIHDVKTELKVSIAYQKTLAEDLKELSQSFKDYQEKADKKEEERKKEEAEKKKMHPLLIGILSGVGVMIFGFVLLEILKLVFAPK